MKFQKQWSDVEATTKEILEVFRFWSISNLEVTYGKDGTLELTYGFPYTSTSSFSMISNTNCIAEYKWDRRFHFEYLAVTEDNLIVAILMDDDEKTLNIPIKYIGGAN